jgi:hypothetical protein
VAYDAGVSGKAPEAVQDVSVEIREEEFDCAIDRLGLDDLNAVAVHRVPAIANSDEVAVSRPRRSVGWCCVSEN